jgi:hypothetical protein
VTVDVREARCPEAPHMPRPMMILAKERQPGRQVPPIREQNVALGVAPVRRTEVSWDGTSGIGRPDHVLGR